jgi:AcrR family transcriptional regulator
MDRIAEGAGVGKGTLYRRFGDRAGLARALLDELEREFQDALIRGPAPLGPGAPAIDRLVAFGAALLDRVNMHGDLILASETGSVGGRFRGSIYAAHRAHVALLLREARPGCDAEYLADALLAALAAELVLFLRTDRGMPIERLKAGFADLARVVASG